MLENNILLYIAKSDEVETLAYISQSSLLLYFPILIHNLLQSFTNQKAVQSKSSRIMLASKLGCKLVNFLITCFILQQRGQS